MISLVPWLISIRNFELFFGFAVPAPKLLIFGLGVKPCEAHDNRSNFLNRRWAKLSGYLGPVVNVVTKVKVGGQVSVSIYHPLQGRLSFSFPVLYRCLMSRRT